MKILTKQIITLIIGVLITTTGFSQFQNNPSPVTVCDGENARFEAFYQDAGGTAVYQWDVDGVTLTGASGTVSGITYTIEATSLGFGNFFSVVLTIQSASTALDGDNVKA